MISSVVFPVRRRTWRSRILRVISTARILGAFISRHSPWREDSEGLISQSYVHFVEETNLLQSYDVLEIPAGERVNLGDCGLCDVPHVGSYLAGRILRAA